MLDHLTTADNARDLDRVRAALGDEQLTMYGISYGGFLGQTYATMFPERVRAIAVDAVLDPVAWTTGRDGADEPMSKRTKAGEASEESLASAFALCDQAGALQCPLSGDALGRWDRVHESLATEPLVLPGGTTIDDQTFEVLTTGVLQIQHISGIGLLDGFRLLATLTRTIELIRSTPAADLLGQAATQLHQLRAATTTATDDTGAADGTEAGRGTQCADSVNPADPKAWITATENYPQAPRFGALNTWSSSWCAGWPGASTDAFHGPFGAPTPLLLINNSHDPVTPIADARATSALYPGSRLIEVNTWGHSALGKSTRCLTPATTAYLIDRTLPAEDRHCAPDHGLWGLAP
jgi:pimeloyl-ACP methyl ester carboxylesterase